MTQKQLADVERGLRLLIGQTHNNACMARLERRRKDIIARFDQEYKQVLETYRVVIGKEPTVA